MHGYTVKISELQALALLSKVKSLSIAADMLGLNQGEVLLRIQTLQLKLGIEVFQRHGRLVSLTRDGLLFAMSCSSVMAILETGAEQAGVPPAALTQFRLPAAISASGFAFRRKRRNMTAPSLAAIVAPLQETK